MSTPVSHESDFLALVDFFAKELYGIAKKELERAYDEGEEVTCDEESIRDLANSIIDDFPLKDTVSSKLLACR